jgi:hypothetical protein
MPVVNLAQTGKFSTRSKKYPTIERKHKKQPQSQTTRKIKYKENRIIFFKNRDVEGESIDCRDEKWANPYIP